MENIEIVGEKLMIIIGLIMLVFGSIGNIFNICVFTIWSRLPNNNNNNSGRTSSTPLYLLISSWSNLFVLLYPLTTRIMFDGFKYLATTQTVYVLCKFRYYALFTFDFISLCCICMATLDRYFISSRRVHLRRLSTTKRQTELIIFIIICLFGLHNIPVIIYYEVSDTGDCIISSQFYSSYYLYVLQILLHGIIPICIFTIFGSLTCKQLKILGQQRFMGIDKQVSRMLFLMSLTIVLSSIPYCVEQLFYVISHENPNQVSPVVSLLHIISSLLFYTNPVFSFYVYYISTPNFRREVWKIILCNRYNRHFINQIHISDVHTHLQT